MKATRFFKGTNRLDFDALSPADNSPAPHSSSSRAGLRKFERELIDCMKYPYTQDLIWQELGGRSSRLEPSASGPHPNRRSLNTANASDFGNDPVWQIIDPWLMQAGSPQAGPSLAEPTLRAQVAPLKIGDFAAAKCHGQTSGSSLAQPATCALIKNADKHAILYRLRLPDEP